MNLAGGTRFGNEDWELFYRLQQQGYHIVYNPNAISWQRYVVTPRERLCQMYEAGTTDVGFVRKHLELLETVFYSRTHGNSLERWVFRPISALPLLGTVVTTALSCSSIRLVECGRKDLIVSSLFYTLMCLEYWRGVHEAGGVPNFRLVRVDV